MKYYLILLSENYADMSTDEIYNELLHRQIVEIDSCDEAGIRDRLATAARIMGGRTCDEAQTLNEVG